MITRVLILVCSIIYSPWCLSAAQFVTKFDPESDIYIDYSDLDIVLNGSVLKMGASAHQLSVSKLPQITGTRIKVGNPLVTRLEGNRLMFHTFSDSQVKTLAKLRDKLLKVVTYVSFEDLNRNEQLAYWLNLHNIIVLAEIASIYPITYLKPVFDENSKDSFINRKKFYLGDEKISLLDIQKHVTTYWKDPVVIYGFYMGAIGTPNVRNEAYQGRKVYRQLEDNAIDFVNSLRGTRYWNKSKLRISTYYLRMKSMFPNFRQSVLAHINKYARGKLKDKLFLLHEVDANIYDWHIADLINGRFSSPGGMYARSTQDAAGNYVNPGLRLPQHAQHILRERAKKLSRKGSVTIEVLPAEEKSDTEDDNS
ncbi:DUF547 domain-containing protein [Kordiimonas aquimaris]|uniref:DUF547 domain-containing protein n=1 Tax=Kordiimonas aquimaris TaxID=707591 RepID=UPI0021D2546A|nr:DUF547 domain-containing protein [Kordiimonas aquimaris]